MADILKLHFGALAVMGVVRIFLFSACIRSFHPWKYVCTFRFCSWGTLPGTSHDSFTSAQKIPGILSFSENEASNGFCGDVIYLIFKKTPADRFLRNLFSDP